MSHCFVYNIGRRFIGCWTTISGSVCNGFGVDDQFHFDTIPTKAGDRPRYLHDEECLTNTCGWLSALTHLTWGVNEF